MKDDAIRYIFGFGSVAIAMILDSQSEYYGGDDSGSMFLMFICCIVGLVLLVPIAFRGFPEAILRNLTREKRPSGGPFSGEATDYFESHPYETTYTDSRGRSWDNTDF